MNLSRCTFSSILVQGMKCGRIHEETKARGAKHGQILRTRWSDPLGFVPSGLFLSLVNRRVGDARVQFSSIDRTVRRPENTIDKTISLSSGIGGMRYRGIGTRSSVELRGRSIPYDRANYPRTHVTEVVCLG